MERGRDITELPQNRLGGPIQIDVALCLHKVPRRDLDLLFRFQQMPELLGDSVTTPRRCRCRFAQHVAFKNGRHTGPTGPYIDDERVWSAIRKTKRASDCALKTTKTAVPLRCCHGVMVDKGRRTLPFLKGKLTEFLTVFHATVDRFHHKERKLGWVHAHLFGQRVFHQLFESIPIGHYRFFALAKHTDRE